jgi:hypothetical protein
LVVRDSGEHYPAIRYRVIDGEGNCVIATRLWMTGPSSISLAPGEYVVEATSDDNHEVVRHEITIAKEPVELALP